MWKKCAVLLLVVTLVNAMSIAVCAQEDSLEIEQTSPDAEGSLAEEEPSLWMTNIGNIKNKLYVNGSHTATINCGVTGLSGVTKATISATLQRQSGSSWVNVQTWTASSASRSTSISKSKAVSAGTKYRVRAVFKAYKGGSPETRTTYSNVVTG